MKVTTLKTVPAQRRKAGAFTLIEMIGVLAVIAILAALLIPKVFTAISNARVNNAAVSCQTVKTALADHYAKFGSIPVDGSSGTPVNLTPGVGAATNYDQVLLKEGFLDKPFAVKIGDGTANTRVEVIDISLLTTNSVVDGTGTTGYNLTGAAGNKNTITGSTVVQAVITGCNESDARDLSERVDGAIGLLTQPTTGTNDFSGRVKYNMGTPTVAYVYLTHR
jgi:type II secretory pathway pseudopilin PulG